MSNGNKTKKTDWTYLGEIKKRLESTDWDDPSNSEFAISPMYTSNWYPHERRPEGIYSLGKIAHIKRSLDHELWWNSIKSQAKAGKMIKEGYKLPPALQASVGDIYPATEAAFGEGKTSTSKDPEIAEIQDYLINSLYPNVSGDILNTKKKKVKAEDKIMNGFLQQDNKYKMGK